MQTFEFEAIPSGDHECFTFAVDKETFVRITGKEPDKYDKSHFDEGLYDLYPSEIFERDVNGEMIFGSKKIKVHVTVEREE